MLEALASLPPDAPLLSDGQRSWSAVELADLVRAETSWLAPYGGTRFALLADNGPAWVIADLALLESASFNVPVPAYFTHQQISHVLESAGIDRLLTDQPDHWLTALPSLTMLSRSPASGLTLLSCVPSQAPVPAPPGTVKVTYTSGSTGTPKGICLGAASQLGLARTLAAQSKTLGVQRHLCLLPLPTLLENLAGVYAPLLAGATCIVLPLATVGMSYGGLDPVRLCAAITQHEPNSLILVPELLRLLVTAAERGWTPPTSLRFIAVGGASVPRELLVRARAAGLPAFEGYGLTECTSVVSLNLPGATRLGSAGRPLPHVRVRIDAEGQIHVRGALQLGTLGEAGPAPDEVATGDLGEMDADGYLYIRGRRRNVFITSFGRNLSPEWIEGVLLQQPAVGQAIVWGESLSHPLAVISPANANTTDSAIDAAVAEANATLPDYARISRWIRAARPFTPADGLLTANGRPRRDAILARYVLPPPVTA